MEAISVGPWGCEGGIHFSHRINNGRIQKLELFYEGGFKSIFVEDVSETPESAMSAYVIEPQIPPSNIIKNSNFRQVIDTYWKWKTDECIVQVISGDTENFVIVSKRKHSYNSIEQDITGEVCVGGVYEVLANVSVRGGGDQEFQMSATVKIENLDSSLSYMHIGSVFVKNLEWKKLECWFHLNRTPKRVIFYIEGPPPNIDLYIGHVSILPVTRRFVVKLNRDEYFTGIIGYYRKIQKDALEVISSLTFLTNRSKYGPFGPEEGMPFSFKMNNGKIIGFHGTASTYLNSVGCHVMPVGSSMSAVEVKKETRGLSDIPNRSMDQLGRKLEHFSLHQGKNVHIGVHME